MLGLFAGLSEIIPERFLRLFNQSELRVLVGECQSRSQSAIKQR